MSDPEDKNRFEDLLASDQAHLRKAAEERIASGMLARVAEAHRQHERRLLVVRLALAGALVAAGLWPDKSPSPGVAKDVPHKVVEPAGAGSQKTPAPQIGVKRIRPPASIHRQPKKSPITARGVTPRQPVFPGNTEPTEQERLMMALAKSDLTRKDKQLPEIAKAISVQVEREKGQRQAFEKWLQEGGEK